MSWQGEIVSNQIIKKKCLFPYSAEISIQPPELEKGTPILKCKSACEIVQIRENNARAITIKKTVW